MKEKHLPPRRWRQYFKYDQYESIFWWITLILFFLFNFSDNFVNEYCWNQCHHQWCCVCSWLLQVSFPFSPEKNNHDLNFILTSNFFFLFFCHEDCNAKGNFISLKVNTKVSGKPGLDHFFLYCHLLHLT